ncbi:Cu(I)-responsive transcriptional regulator [Thermomonas sp.]|uniref:Cu(I)-responsive transcriptional regulator n=1 Tax=Thermomonas sp. TaxID=1971895 RepID=UPI00261B7D59|nr:Cu(I)-responsive transcriptional regulator [Thermomonas sp.]MCO5055729.1 Cu(I)-responsive transcriptional regulator [Thermomonas sp.]
MNRNAVRPELADALRDGFHNIGQASEFSGISTKMIRHYERIGLMPEAVRTYANYRLYSAADLHRLRFIRRARSLGFSLDQIRDLLTLWDDPKRASSEVKRLARAHAAELGEKIRELQAMQATLETLAKRCHGDDRPSCPILEDLAEGGAGGR